MPTPLPHDRSEFFQTDTYWNAVQKFLENELHNDGTDITSQIFLQKNEKFLESNVQVIAKENGNIGGIEELDFFLEHFFPEISYSWEKNIQNGVNVEKNQKIFSASGNAYDIMKMERIFLNILSRMSGIVTTTKKLQEISGNSGVQLAATRKTQWSFLDKKAVFLGGGLTHRMGLFDAIMIKENHQITGGYNLSLENFLEKNPENFSPAFIEIETETQAEFSEVFTLFWKSKNSIPKVIMLDNFSPQTLQKILKKYPEKNERHSKNIFLEASGGITKKTLAEYSKTGVDVVSMGALTNNVTPIDFSMRAIPSL